MKILGIDTSTKYLSVAIAEGNDVKARFQDKGELQHSSLLIPTIDKLLKKCGLKLGNIDTIALSIGPGSFAGLRIGVATCKGINLALGIPIIAVPTLDVIAYNFMNGGGRALSPLIDGKKGNVYTCLYREPSSRLAGPERLTDYLLLDIAGFLKIIDRPTLVFGDGVRLYESTLSKNPFVSASTDDWLPKAEVVAKLGFIKARKREFANPDKLVPMYLHSKYCQVTKKI